MDYTLTPEQITMQKKLRAEFREKIAPNAASVDAAGEFPVENWAILKEAGYHGILLSESGEADLVSGVLAAEELAACCGSTALCASASAWMCGIAIAAGNNDDVKKKWLPALSSGSAIGAYAITEADGGTLQEIKTVANRNSSDYLLTGGKVYVTNGAVADVFVVFALCDGVPRAFLVEKGASGLTVTPGASTMGMRGAALADLKFEDCHAVDLGDEAVSAKIAKSMVLHGRLYSAALGIGLARAAYEAGKHRAENRRAAGKPLGAHQEVSFMIADMYAEADAARQLTMWAAWSIGKGSSDALVAVSCAKLYASETAVRNASRAVRIFGADGYANGSVAERLYRDVKYLEIGDGPSEVVRMNIADEIIGEL